MTEIPQKRPSKCYACGEVFRNWGALANHVRFGGRDSCTDEARFWGSVDKTSGKDECWPFLGFIKWDGYGWVRRANKNIAAHRYAWALTHGTIADGKHVLHICDYPRCCNPTHMRLGTHGDNMADMKAKGRHHHGKTPVTDLLHPDRVRPVRRQA